MSFTTAPTRGTIARVGPQGWPKRGMKSYALLVMSRSEPEGAPEGSQPPEGRAPQGTHTGHTQTQVSSAAYAYGRTPAGVSVGELTAVAADAAYLYYFHR